VVCNRVFKNKKIQTIEGQYFIGGVRESQVQKTCNNLQKNVHLKYLFTKKRVSQVLIYQKTCKERAKTSISNFFGPISKTCVFKVCAAWGRAAQGPTVSLKGLVQFQNKKI
jgi:hypothetical protein